MKKIIQLATRPGDLMLPVLPSFGLLFLRVGAGMMMAVAHGLPKLLDFQIRSASFPDPLGTGSGMALSLAIFAELFCSLALVVGLGTRLVTVPLIITMLTAAFIIHADDPWNKKEFALLYAIPFIALFIAGPGRFSLDRWIARRSG